jgi:hypothetical protein
MALWLLIVAPAGALLLLLIARMQGRGAGAPASPPGGSLAERTGGAPPPGGRALTLPELRALAASVGFPDPDMAAAVAMAESGGHPAILGDQGHSVGLWQINLPSHPEMSALNLTDPTTNAHAALTISKNGTDWSPWWTTMHTGSYKRFLPAVPSS